MLSKKAAVILSANIFVPLLASFQYYNKKMGVTFTNCMTGMSDSLLKQSNPVNACAAVDFLVKGTAQDHTQHIC